MNEATKRGGRKPQQVDLDAFPDTLLTSTTIAHLYGVAVRTVWDQEKAGLIPPAVRKGRFVRWPARVIAADMRRRGLMAPPLTQAAERSGTTFAPET